MASFIPRFINLILGSTSRKVFFLSPPETATMKNIVLAKAITVVREQSERWGQKLVLSMVG